MKILKLNNVFIFNLNKAYTEGVYTDSPLNRKLGRVGMTYTAYAEKVKKEKKEPSIREILSKKAENIVKDKLGFDVELTFRTSNELTLIYSGKSQNKLDKINKFFNQGNYKSEVTSDYDDELGETFVYISLQHQNEGEKKETPKEEKKEEKVVEGIYADTPANRKLGRVGMTYQAYYEKLEREKEANNPNKKNYTIEIHETNQMSGGSYPLGDGPMSKEKMIKEGTKFLENFMSSNLDHDKFSFDITEEDENFDKENPDWLSFRGERLNNGKIDITIYDYKNNEYIRNDFSDRLNKNLKQKMRIREKEFQKKMDSLNSFQRDLHKSRQLTIIENNNPMTDDYHVGIRNLEDISTFDEKLKQDPDKIFVYSDFTKEDAQKAKEKGSITIYSSHPIDQGVFVTPSKKQAQDYAGSQQVYSKEVPLDEVAWITEGIGCEGQYAKII